MLTRRKPLKRTALKRKSRKKQPGDDPKYLAWIRTLPCELWPKDFWTCEDFPCKGLIEAHHSGDHGFAQKAPDRTAIPLCAHHHRDGADSAHVLGKRFWTHHNLDRDSIIRELQERYDQLNA